VRRFVVLAAVAAAVVVVSSVLAAGEAVAPKYRFSGWVTANALPSAPPKHLIFEGDAGTLRFLDASNTTKKRTAYKVCVFKRGVSKGQCRRGTAPLDTSPSKLPLFARCCAEWVAKWYVGGHVVATWQFLFLPERS
jgi:hypothetical protein